MNEYTVVYHTQSDRSKDGARSECPVPTGDTRSLPDQTGAEMVGFPL
jgi:hypothetical protein